VPRAVNLASEQIARWDIYLLAVPRAKEQSNPMIRTNVTVCLFAAGLALSACKSVPPPPQTWKYSGHELVERKCGGCHAVDMSDIGPNPDSPPLRDLFKRYPIDGLDEAFTKGLSVGHYDMPRFTVAPEERAEILSYLKSLNPCAKPSSDDIAMRRCFAPLPDAPASPVQ